MLPVVQSLLSCMAVSNPILGFLRSSCRNDEYVSDLCPPLGTAEQKTFAVDSKQWENTACLLW